MNPEIQAAEKAALAIALPYASAGVDKLAANKPAALEYLKAEGHTVGSLVVATVEKAVSSDLKGLLAPVGRVIDDALVAGEAQFEALAASQEDALYNLGIAFLRSEIAHLQAVANG